MILAQIKTYLQQRGSACLSDIALHFDSTPDAVRGMLAIWIGKGKVRRHGSDAACSSCGHCEPERMEWYEWVDPDRE